ncbi:tudor and KH domain-containing protein-like isoform X2 [Limulus polyphemus]|uniref:Tudor and KH domain-containing protein-like isoform X2 n=1 Tax=Limulus polyphemus TaxID=6850 RepID=A0ABM1S5J1_LIMPO|nr:tudor and KH domain-containing protein-like isoform X2 [Limulus polyphemus]
MVIFQTNDLEEQLELSTKGGRKSQQVTTSRQTVIHVNVPKSAIGGVIGRQGSTIKKIQEQTNTKIKFEEKGLDVEEKVAVIRGSPENAQEAENLLYQLINEQPQILTEDVFVPVRVCGRIIGRNGDTIRTMCRISGAKITLDRGGDERDPDNQKRVTIRGTRDQIDIAISLIDEKLAEDEAFRQKISLSSSSAQTLQHRGRPLSIGASSDEANVSSHQELQQELLVPSAADGYTEVFVSAVENPGSFWVQTVGTKSVQLDKMVEEMTEFYTQQCNQELTRVSQVSVGDIVAAPFEHDHCWYRGIIVNIHEDDYNLDESEITIHFVDFGDYCKLKRKELCTLLPIYKVLPFQAIECRLAWLQPKGSVWNDEATNLFEKLSHVAQWKVLMAKQVSSLKKQSEQREVTVYAVELIDTNEPQDINIGLELVQKGYAMVNKNNRS